MLQGCGEELYQLLLFAAVLLSGSGGAWFCWVGHCDRILLLCRALPEVLKKKGEKKGTTPTPPAQGVDTPIAIGSLMCLAQSP